MTENCSKFSYLYSFVSIFRYIHGQGHKNINIVGFKMFIFDIVRALGLRVSVMFESIKSKKSGLKMYWKWKKNGPNLDKKGFKRTNKRTKNIEGCHSRVDLLWFPCPIPRQRLRDYLWDTCVSYSADKCAVVDKTTKH